MADSGVSAISSVVAATEMTDSHLNARKESPRCHVVRHDAVTKHFYRNCKFIGYYHGYHHVVSCRATHFRVQCFRVQEL